MDLIRLTTSRQLETAADLAWRQHVRLRTRLPFLPVRTAADFAPKLAWLAEHGVGTGAVVDGELVAFLGAFVLPDFRNAGPAAFSPDWAHGALVAGAAATATYRALYRRLVVEAHDRRPAIHAAAAWATDQEMLEALLLTGFGRIVADAARPVSELLAALAGTGSDGVRPALATDAEALAALDAGLAAHIAAVPVLGQKPRGRTPDAWSAWLALPDARAYVAADGARILGFIKAQDPQLDVSDAVHGPQTLAINGLFVRPEARGQGVAGRLLAALVRGAAAEGRALVSVDCETTNREAWAFWPRWFAPVAYGHERRV